MSAGGRGRPPLRRKRTVSPHPVGEGLAPPGVGRAEGYRLRGDVGLRRRGRRPRRPVLVSHHPVGEGLAPPADSRRARYSYPAVGDGVLDVPAVSANDSRTIWATSYKRTGSPFFRAGQAPPLRRRTCRGARCRGGACPSRCPDDSAEPGDEAKTDESAVGAAISRPFCRSRTRVTALRKRPVPAAGGGRTGYAIRGPSGTPAPTEAVVPGCGVRGPSGTPAPTGAPPLAGCMSDRGPSGKPRPYGEERGRGVGGHLISQPVG